MPPRLKTCLLRAGWFAAGWLAWVAAVLGYRELRGGAAEPVVVTVRCRGGVERTELLLFQRTRSGAELAVLPELFPLKRAPAGSPSARTAESTPFRGPEQTAQLSPKNAALGGEETRGPDGKTGMAKPWWSTEATSRQEWRWVIKGSWVRGLKLVAAGPVLSQLEEITITGAHRRSTIRPDLLTFREKSEPPQHIGTDGHGEFVSADLPPLGQSSHSVLPGFSGLWNYPGDLALVQKVVWSVVCHPATWFLAIGLLAALLFERRLGSAAEKILEAPENRREFFEGAWAKGRPGLWFGVGALYLVTATVYLEWRNPRYFLQDDNFAIFLPAILRGCEIFRTGCFPEWTVYQFLGMPLAQLGTFALTYPPTYLAYFFAAYAIGDATWTLEIFCWSHLLVGYWGMFLLLRRERMVPAIAAWGGLCWALSGYALIASRSWYYMAPAVAFLPLLGMQLLRLDSFRGPELKRWRCAVGWVLTTGLLGGLFYHAGNAQMWLYAVQLFGLGAILRGLWRKWEWRRWVLAAAGVTCAVAIAGPLLIPQLMVISGVRRPAGPHEGIFDGLLALILPYPLAQAPSPCTWADPTSPHHGQLYFAGGVFTAMWLAGMARLLVKPKAARAMLGSFWHAIAILAFVLALGNVGGLWWLQSKLPLFGQAYHPFKYLPFFHLAALVLGAGYLQRWVIGEAFSSSKSGLWRSSRKALTAWAFCGMVLLAWHVFLSDTCFYRYGDQTYEPLPAKLEAILKSPEGSARVLPISPFRSPARRFVWGLGLDFPLVYGIESVSGYSEFVRQTPQYRRVLDRLAADPLAALREYGVDYVILHRTAAHPVRSQSWEARWAETENLFDDQRIRTWCRETWPIYFDDSVAAFPVGRSKPLAFWRGPSETERVGGKQGGEGRATPPTEFPVSDSPAEHPTPAAVHLRKPSGAYLKVDCGGAKKGGELILNYLWSPWFRAFADDRPVKVAADPLGRILITVPPGTKELCVFYRPPWLAGGIFGLLCLSLGLSLTWAACQAKGTTKPEQL